MSDLDNNSVPGVDEQNVPQTQSQESEGDREHREKVMHQITRPTMDFLLRVEKLRHYIACNSPELLEQPSSPTTVSWGTPTGEDTNKNDNGLQASATDLPELKLKPAPINFIGVFQCLNWKLHQVLNRVVGSDDENLDTDGDDSEGIPDWVDEPVSSSSESEQQSQPQVQP